MPQWLDEPEATIYTLLPGACDLRLVRMRVDRQPPQSETDLGLRGWIENHCPRCARDPKRNRARKFNMYLSL